MFCMSMKTTWKHNWLRNINIYHIIPFHFLTTMWLKDQGAHVRERLTANRSDLTLQGGPNQHCTYLPRRTISESWKKSQETNHLNTTERPLSALIRSDRCNRPIRPVCMALWPAQCRATGQTGVKDRSDRSPPRTKTLGVRPGWQPLT